MNLNGWIGFPRAFMSEPWYRDAPAFARALYLHLALSANFTTTTTRTGLILNPGQLVTSWAKLTEEMAGMEKGRRIKPTLWKVRYTAGLLKRAGLIAWTTAPPTAGGGIVVTLERWALHVGEGEIAADVAAESTAPPLRYIPQHRNNTTGPAAPREKTTLELIEEWKQRERESMQELREVRARERGETVQ